MGDTDPRDAALTASLRENRALKDLLQDVLDVVAGAYEDDTSVPFEDALEGELLVKWSRLMARAASAVMQS